MVTCRTFLQEHMCEILKRIWTLLSEVGAPRMKKSYAISYEAFTTKTTLFFSRRMIMST